MKPMTCADLTVRCEGDKRSSLLSPRVGNETNGHLGRQNFLQLNGKRKWRLGIKRLKSFSNLR